MFTSPLVIANKAAANKSFTVVSQDKTGTNRLDVSTTLVQPRTLSIRHSTIGKGSTAIDRHLVQFQVTKTDVNSSPSTATVNLTIAMPRSGTIVDADILDVVALIKNFLTDANVAGLLIGES